MHFYKGILCRFLGFTVLLNVKLLILLLILFTGPVRVPNSRLSPDSARESLARPATIQDQVKSELSCEGKGKDVTHTHGSVTPPPIKHAVKPEKNHSKPSEGDMKSVVNPTTLQPVPSYQAGALKSVIDFPSLTLKPAGIPGQSTYNSHHSLTTSPGTEAGDGPKRDHDKGSPINFTADDSGVFSDMDMSSSISDVNRSDDSGTVEHHQEDIDDRATNSHVAEEHSSQEALVVVSGQRDPVHSMGHVPTEMETTRSEHLCSLVTGISLHPDYSECRLSGVVEGMKKVRFDL